MGKAGRWLRGLLSGKKVEEEGRAAENRPFKEKKKWEFIKSFREKDKGRAQKEEPLPRVAAVAEAVSEQRKWSYRETRETYLGCSPARSRTLADGNEQNKRAIAVAAATAAVAEAAVAAAQAAAAVVRLTSSGKSGGFCTAGMMLEEWAALKVQAAFRGYLARRALRALKGLVKLQALVRGNIVRKKAAETLRCMQALVRVQARARACRALGSETSRSSKSSRSNPSPPTPEKYESSILRSANSYHSGSLKRTSSKKTRMDAANKDSGHSGNWNWLDQWMEERYWDTRQVSKAMDDEKYTKILEVDTCKPPQFNSRRRTNHHQYACSPINSNQNSRKLASVPDFASKDSTTARICVPSPSSFDDRHESPSPLRLPIVVEPVNMGESPQFFSAASRPGSSRRSPFTPAKSECSRSLFSGYTDYPNYMSYTESSRAKVRSQSAPKQRPECEKSSWIKKPSAHGFGGQQAATSQRYSVVNKEYPG